jgi:hypothetical protein
MSRIASQPRLPAILFALGLLLVASAGPRSAQAAANAVSIGDVVVALDGEVTSTTLELKRELRGALIDELTSLAASDSAPAYPLVVSATLTKLSSEKGAQQAKASAAISLALRRADDQNLFAEVLGRASAEEARGSVASVRRAALRGAVRGAVARLPEAMRRKH